MFGLGIRTYARARSADAGVRIVLSVEL
jgi:hypothetical protein